MGLADKINNHINTLIACDLFYNGREVLCFVISSMGSSVGKSEEPIYLFLARCGGCYGAAGVVGASEYQLSGVISENKYAENSRAIYTSQLDSSYSHTRSSGVNQDVVVFFYPADYNQCLESYRWKVLNRFPCVQDT